MSVFSEFDEFVIAGTDSQFLSGLDCVESVLTVDPLQEMILSGIVRVLHKVQTGLVDRDGV